MTDKELVINFCNSISQLEKTYLDLTKSEFSRILSDENLFKAIEMFKTIGLIIAFDQGDITGHEIRNLKSGQKDKTETVQEI